MKNELIKIKRAAQVMELAAANLSCEIDDLLGTSGDCAASDAGRSLTPKIVELVREHPGMKRSDLIELVMHECGVPRHDAFTKINGAVRAKKISYDRTRDSVLPYDEAMFDGHLNSNPLSALKVAGIVAAQPGINQPDLVTRIMDEFGVSRPTAYRKIDVALATKKISIHPALKTLYPYRESMDEAIQVKRTNRFTTEQIVDVVANKPGIFRNDLIRMMVEQTGMNRVSAYQKLYCAIRLGKVIAQKDGKMVALYVEASR